QIVEPVAVDDAARGIVLRRDAAQTGAVAGLAQAAGRSRCDVHTVRMAVAEAAALVRRVALVIDAVPVRIRARGERLTLPGRIAPAAAAALGVAADAGRRVRRDGAGAAQTLGVAGAGAAERKLGRALRAPAVHAAIAARLTVEAELA